jgi:chorismate mutase/prephenate dehydratase
MADSLTGDELLKLRERIDQLDEEMLLLLNERAQCALSVAEVKQKQSPDVPPVFYRPEREAQVLRHVMDINQGPLTNEKVAQVYRQIMSACLALEQPLRVAYLGPEGTFTQLAAMKHFGDSVIGLPMVTQDDVFREVQSESCNYGVVPVENSTQGVISHTLDNFLESSLKICGEVHLRVHHYLMVAGDTSEEQIERIYAHQQALGQCRRWLDAHFPRASRIAVTSNSEAARRIRDEPQAAAAIAPEICAGIYGLRVVSGKIEDRSDNTTRFLVVGREEVGASGNDKTSILVSTHNQPGALYKLLEPFHRHSVDLTSIETRPSRTGIWSYVFFIDFQGHRDDPAIRQVLGEIDADALEVKLLGSYPRAVVGL